MHKEPLLKLAAFAEPPAQFSVVKIAFVLQMGRAGWVCPGWEMMGQAASGSSVPLVCVMVLLGFLEDLFPPLARPEISQKFYSNSPRAMHAGRMRLWEGDELNDLDELNSLSVRASSAQLEQPHGKGVRDVIPLGGAFFCARST